MEMFFYLGEHGEHGGHGGYLEKSLSTKEHGEYKYKVMYEVFFTAKNT